MESSCAPWGARIGAASVAVGNQIWLAGGSSGDTWHNDVWTSMDGGATWTEVTGTASWSPRRHAGLVAIGRKLVILGGGGQDAMQLASASESLDGGASWQPLSGVNAPTWAARDRMAAVTVQQLHQVAVVVIGGVYESSTTEHADVHALCPGLPPGCTLFGATMVSCTDFTGTHLDVAGAGISALGQDAFAGLSSVLAVDLSSNPLRQLPTTPTLPSGLFHAMSSLVDLRLDNTGLVRLPRHVLLPLPDAAKVTFPSNSDQRTFTNGAPCTARSCTNGLLSGDETDVDCGGITCTTCISGQQCAANADCTNGHCTAGGVCATCGGGTQTSRGITYPVDAYCLQSFGAANIAPAWAGLGGFAVVATDADVLVLTGGRRGSQVLGDGALDAY